MGAETMEIGGFRIPEDDLAEINRRVDTGEFANTSEAIRYSIVRYNTLPWSIEVGTADAVDELLYHSLEEPDRSIAATVETELEETRTRKEGDGLWRCEGRYGESAFMATGLHPELAYDNLVKKISGTVRSRAEEYGIV